MQKPEETLSFQEEADRVLKWNLMARGGNDEFTEEDYDLALDLVKEEAKELLEEHENRNRVGFLKELIDYFVVSCHLLAVFNRLSHLPYSANIKTFDVASIEGDIDALSIENVDDILNIEVACSILSQVHANVKPAMNEVLSSNESKFPTQQQLCDAYDTKDWHEAVEKECLRIEKESNGRYTGVSATYYGDFGGYFVFKDSNGKIMKPITYKPADVSPFVY